ncbi:MAG: hypothetical protein J0I80_07485, partial [Sphingomonas sp.]|nr:hypothetical protein [Sphingomonas sp.]
GHEMKDNDAPQIVARDDAASSKTISERPQIEEASGDGAGDDRTVPFARSRFSNVYRCVGFQ